MATIPLQTFDLRDGAPRFAVVPTHEFSDSQPTAAVEVIRAVPGDPRLTYLLSDPLTASRWEADTTTNDSDIIELSLIVAAHTAEAVGAIAATDVDLRHGHARILLATLPGTDCWRRTLQGTIAFIDRFFASYPVAKLYLELLDEELDRLRSGIGRFLSHEATFRGHLFWQGRRLDVNTIAIAREDWEDRSSGTLLRAIDRISHSDDLSLPDRAAYFIGDIIGTHVARREPMLVAELCDRSVPSQLDLERDLGMDALALAELDAAVAGRSHDDLDGRPVHTVGELVAALAAPGIRPLFSPC
jgi:hypothetical protein